MNASTRAPSQIPSTIDRMAPLLAQSRPLALYRALQSSNNRVSGIGAPHRAIQRVQSHVMRAAKLDDIESSEIKGTLCLFQRNVRFEANC